LREERGLGMSGLIGFDRLALDDDEDGDEAALEAMLRESKYEEEEMMATEAGDKQGAKAARQKLASSKRLHRVDIIYVSPTFFVTTLFCSILTNRNILCQSCRVALSSSSNYFWRRSLAKGHREALCRLLYLLFRRQPNSLVSQVEPDVSCPCND